MDRAYINEQHVIERYLRGTLTPEELTAFEIYMLDHPETVDDIEYARALQSALVGAKEALGADGATPPQGGSFWGGPRYALAASALLGVAILTNLYAWRDNAVLTDEIGRLRAPLAVSTEVRFESLRGGNRALIVEKRPDEALLFSVGVGSAEPGPYTVRIQGADGSFAWEQAAVTPDLDGAVRVVARDLAFGTYELTITSSSASVIATHEFELVPLR